MLFKVIFSNNLSTAKVTNVASGITTDAKVVKVGDAFRVKLDSICTDKKWFTINPNKHVDDVEYTFDDVAIARSERSVSAFHLTLDNIASFLSEDDANTFKQLHEKALAKLEHDRPILQEKAKLERLKNEMARLEALIAEKQAEAQ